MPTIAVVGTYDTKGLEHEFVANQIRALGHQPLLIDVGGFGDARVPVDVTCQQVAELAAIDLHALRVQADRGALVAAMSKAAPVLLAKLVKEVEFRAWYRLAEQVAQRSVRRRCARCLSDSPKLWSRLWLEGMCRRMSMCRTS